MLRNTEDLHVMTEKSLERPAFVYFDLGNVIVHFDHELGYQKMADVAGCSPDRVRDALTDDIQRTYETGEIDARVFYDHFCKLTETKPDFDRLYRASGDIFHLNIPVISVITELRSRGVPLGVLSNTCAAHWDHCVQHYRLVRDMFAVTVLSYVVKCMKPDAAIYQAAIAQADCTPDRIVFVDDRTDNVASAISAGLDAIQYTSAGKLAEDLRQRGLIA
ncbi:MAG: HAD family phosphatase [Pirellulaceae bacterium]